MKHLLSRVIVASEQGDVHVRPYTIVDVGRDGSDSLIDSKARHQDQTQPLVLTAPARLTRRGRELKLILGNEHDRPDNPDPDLIAVVARASHWLDLLMTGKVRSIRDLARTERGGEPHIGQQLRLAFLAPDIVEAILEGKQPATLTAGQLIKSNPPLDWHEQRRLLGFAT